MSGLLASTSSAKRKFRINRWSRHRFKFVIRTATLDDVAGIVEVERRTWEPTGTPPWGEREVSASLSAYPEGMTVAERNVDGQPKIEAFMSYMRISEEMFRWIVEGPSSWEEVTSNGHLLHHRADGAYFYGVNLAIPPRMERLGIGNRLRGSAAREAIAAGVRGIVLESRLPKLRSFNDSRSRCRLERLTGTEYVALRDARGRPYDPELRNYLATPFMEMLAVKEGYFQDPQSENCGVLLLWRNPLFRVRLGFLYRLGPLSSPIVNLIARAVAAVV